MNTASERVVSLFRLPIRNNLASVLVFGLARRVISGMLDKESAFKRSPVRLLTFYVRDAVGIKHAATSVSWLSTERLETTSLHMLLTFLGISRDDVESERPFFKACIFTSSLSSDEPTILSSVSMKG